MTGRQLYGLYRDARAGVTGITPPMYDALAQQERMVWEHLLEAIRDTVLEEIADEGG